jgi:hypothetical protein
LPIAGGGVLSCYIIVTHKERDGSKFQPADGARCHGSFGAATHNNKTRILQYAQMFPIVSKQLQVSIATNFR